MLLAGQYLDTCPTHLSHQVLAVIMQPTTALLYDGTQRITGDRVARGERHGRGGGKGRWCH